MDLEAGAFKPLHRIGPSVAQRLGAWAAERQAEEGQVFSLALARLPVDLNALRPPGPQQRATDIMARLGEEAAVALRRALGKALPDPLALHKRISAQAADQHIARAGVLGVQLQPVALKPLHLKPPTLDLLLAQRRHRQAEGAQPIVLAPELADAPADTVGGLLKAELVALGQRGGRQGGKQQRQGEQQHVAVAWHKRLLNLQSVTLQGLSAPARRRNQSARGSAAPARGSAAPGRWSAHA
jgi:hypothetical protein